MLYVWTDGGVNWTDGAHDKRKPQYFCSDIGDAPKNKPDSYDINQTW